MYKISESRQPYLNWVYTACLLQAGKPSLPLVAAATSLADSAGDSPAAASPARPDPARSSAAASCPASAPCMASTTSTHCSFLHIVTLFKWLTIVERYPFLGF